MNWKNIKSFLILLFLCINVFLLIVIYNSHNAKELTDKNIEDAVHLLKSNNIIIDKDIIPKTAKSYSMLELSLISPTNSNSIDKSLISASDDGTISIAIDELSSNIGEQSNENTIKNMLKKHGFNKKNIIIEAEPDGYYISEKTNDMQVFNNRLKVSTQKEYITLNGLWYDCKVTDYGIATDTKTVYATSALIAFISEQTKKDKTVYITDISFGYYAVIDKNTSNAKSISALPCYRLTDNDNNIYYYNILDGSFVQ